MKLRVCIISAGVLPVPAVDGGAVENLIQTLCDKNEEYRKLTITVLSIYSKSAIGYAEKYTQSSFCFAKDSMFIALIDKLIFCIARYILRKQNLFSYKNILRRLYYIYQCSRHLLKNDYDRIVAVNHHSLFLLLKSIHLKKKIRQRLYYYSHCIPRGEFFCKKEIYDCQKYITVSNFIIGEYKKRYAGIASQFVTLFNAVDTGRFSRELNREKRAIERARYNLSIDDIVLVFVGRICAEKGILELAKAYTQVPNPRIKLLIAGSNIFNSNIASPINGQLRDILNSCGDRVLFTGYVQYDEIWKLYALADIGCFPSVCNEAAGLTIIEAMNAGIPFITTDAGGIPEYCNRDCAIILKRDENLVNNIKESIELLAREVEMRRAMGTAGRKRGAQYNLDRYYSDFVEVIKR